MGDRTVATRRSREEGGSARGPSAGGGDEERGGACNKTRWGGGNEMQSNSKIFFPGRSRERGISLARKERSGERK